MRHARARLFDLSRVGIPRRVGSSHRCGRRRTDDPIRFQRGIHGLVPAPRWHVRCSFQIGDHAMPIQARLPSCAAAVLCLLLWRLLVDERARPHAAPRCHAAARDPVPRARTLGTLRSPIRRARRQGGGLRPGGQRGVREGVRRVLAQGPRGADGVEGPRPATEGLRDRAGDGSRGNVRRAPRIPGARREHPVSRRSPCSNGCATGARRSCTCSPSTARRRTLSIGSRRVSVTRSPTTSPSCSSSGSRRATSTSACRSPKK